MFLRGWQAVTISVCMANKYIASNAHLNSGIHWKTGRQEHLNVFSICENVENGTESWTAWIFSIEFTGNILYSV